MVPGLALVVDVSFAALNGDVHFIWISSFPYPPWHAPFQELNMSSKHASMRGLVPDIEVFAGPKEEEKTQHHCSPNQAIARTALGLEVSTKPSEHFRSDR